MTVDEFYWCTTREAYNYIIGHQRIQWKISEDHWNMSRHLMYYVSAPYLKKGDSAKLTDFVRLHMDDTIDTQAFDPYNEQKIREWCDLMDSIPFSDPSEYRDDKKTFKEIDKLLNPKRKS